jgi:hypothetical protein
MNGDTDSYRDKDIDRYTVRLRDRMDRDMDRD